MLNINFGLAIASETGNPKELEKYLQEALDLSIDAVELSFTKVERIGDSITDKVIELFDKFKYKSIHLPVKHNGQYFTYPDKSIDKDLQIIDKILQKINVDTVLVHPDQIGDSNWLADKYGKLLAFENMDIRKNFGKSVNEMKQVFDKFPQAKFVCDVNHIWTNDHSMETAKDYFNEFHNRLTHYHLSGYGGLHDALCRSREDEILKGLMSFDCPIIDEGHLSQKGLIKEEYQYILDCL